MFKVEMTGNLTKDPTIAEREVVDTETGEIVKRKVCNFTVAANSGYGAKAETAYFKVHCWGEKAEVCYKNLSKGRAVYCEGPVRMNSYIGSDKQFHTVMEVRGDEIEFLGGRIKTSEEINQPVEPEEPEDLVY